MNGRGQSALEVAAAELRRRVMAAEPGALLGSEASLQELLGASKSTIRQVARLLEREGLLMVRRGINGGYFAGRPTLATVEAAVSAYLNTLDMEVEEVTLIASLLWIEAMRKAALVRTDAARDVARALRARVMRLRSDAPLSKILELERDSRTEIFALTKTGYIELIFQINIAFARSRFPPESESDDPGLDPGFLAEWRRGKVLELDAVIGGDPELAVLAARHVRNLWHGRLWPAGRPPV